MFYKIYYSKNLIKYVRLSWQKKEIKSKESQRLGGNRNCAETNFSLGFYNVTNIVEIYIVIHWGIKQKQRYLNMI